MKNRMFALATLVALCLFLAAGAARAADDEIGTGQLRVLTKEKQVVEVPLAHTAVEAQISGFVARVNVIQTFVNPFPKPIEAVYVFPLPHDAAVDDMTMTIGKRVIKGIIKKKEEAREIYEKAKAAGQTASLLDQERPNIFTQSVANILPGDNIEIKISYVQALKFENGEYEYVFPMVVGPRYIPGETVIGKSGGGWAPDTNRVPDASKITPPVLKPGQRSGHDIDVTLKIDAGVAFHDLRSPSHNIVTKDEGKGRTMVTLQPSDTLPNKDLIVRYNVLGKDLDVGVLTSTKNGAGFFLLMLAPKAKYAAQEIRPREMIFIIDSSGSQQGDPLAKSKEAVKRALKGLRPGDTFQVFDFNDTISSMAAGPVDATPENIKEAKHFIDEIKSLGGTRMLPAIQAALVWPPDPQRLRIIFMTTDGLIGNETEIIGEIHKSLGDARLFSLGVGSSTNRWLLQRMAEEGKGFAQFVRQDEPTEAVIETFHKRIDAPLLTDIEIDWGHLQVTDVQPLRVPDLFAGQPVVLIGRYTKPGEGTVRLIGKRGTGRGELSARVVFPAKDGGYSALATMWARAKIRALSDEMDAKGQAPELVEQVTRLGLDYRLVTQFTSFVAVEEEIRNKDGKPVTVQVPVELPEGMSYEGVFGTEETLAVTKNVGGGMGAGMGTYSAAPAPSSAMRAPAQKAKIGGSTGAVLADEVAGDTRAAGPRLDPIAFLGITEVPKYQQALQTEFYKAIAKKLDSIKMPTGKSMMVRLTLNAAGAVKKAEFQKDDTGNAQVRQIIEKALLSMKLPAPGKEATIVFFLYF